jgi:DNA (cytosine-5)-methyltransferase 1
MRKRRGKLAAADLFCGAGGASNGLHRACLRRGVSLDLVAVNHWPLAIETHKANHPEAMHYCEPVENINPRQAVPSGRLDLLMAGPECTHHSIARGGKPINDQSRASAWCILRWATTLEIESILIENVREFREWGPLGRNNRPLKSRKGETFDAFINALRSLNYRVEWRILNAANYGDPTTRERLFIQARKGRKPITWPVETHSPDGGATLFGTTEKWRPAREIIDWSIAGKSIFGRKRPLKPNTLARIAAGIERFWGDMARPFLVMLNGGGRKGPGGVRTLDEPLPVVTAGGNHFGLCEPFLLQQQSNGAPRRVSNPVPTIATAGKISLIQPFILPQFGEARARSIDRPLGTITTTSRGVGLVAPFVVKYNSTGGARSIADPLDTVTTRDRFGLVAPQCGAYLDILFRMLQPHELAAAMGFDSDYQFCGSREDMVKQIGNAWPNHLAEALCSEIIGSVAA